MPEVKKKKAKRGPKPEVKAGKKKRPISVSLSERELLLLKGLSGGSVSVGIAILVELYANGWGRDKMVGK